MAETVDCEEWKGSKISLIIKTAKEKEIIEIEENASVKELKDIVAEKMEAELEQICLIFAGKILKDHETLETHKIKDGLTVHLVLRSKKTNEQQQPQPQAPRPPTDTGTTTQPNAVPPVAPDPFNMGSFGGLPAMENFGLGGNLMEMQQRIMSNPDMLRQMMENPFVQQMMSNPDYIRTIITANPQMQNLMERNPEINHMLNNPDLLRQTMEMVRNPSMLQELMRTQDRALSNLESIPGGYNALRRMYTELQEPMLNAAQEQFGGNPFAALVGDANSSSNLQQGTENRDPLPNPWAPPTPSTGSNTTTTTNASSTAGSAPNSTFASSPGMQSLMQQMIDNPSLMQNMMSSPYMQSMMQSLTSNPEMMQHMVTNNPLFASNPALQEQMRTMMPQFIQQMQSPEMQSVMTNPQALEAIMQIQRGMEQLQRVAPHLVSMNNLLGTFPVNSTSSTTTSSQSTTTTTSTPTTQSNPMSPSNAAALSQLMAQMFTGGNQSQDPPEIRYRNQLEQLAAMGFMNRDANIRALNETAGDINAAVERLLH